MPLFPPVRPSARYAGPQERVSKELSPTSVLHVSANHSRGSSIHVPQWEASHAFTFTLAQGTYCHENLVNACARDMSFLESMRATLRVSQCLSV